MKKIANIISQNEIELVNHKKVEWINYLRYLPDNGITDRAVDYKLPTLYIGWNNFQTHFQRFNPSILNKKNTVKDYPLTWEFSKEEKMSDHFNGINSFVKNAPREFCETYKYISIDPIKNSIKNEDDVIKLIPFDLSDYSYQYKNEIVYVLNKKSKTIYGIFLNSFKYFQYDINKISALIQSRVLVAFNDPNGEIYQQYYKQFPDFDQLKRTMVLFLS